LFFEKNANFFAENWQKSQKIVIITSTPDLAKFGHFGEKLCYKLTYVKGLYFDTFLSNLQRLLLIVFSQVKFLQNRTDQGSML
jgi:hypothetical protein